MTTYEVISLALLILIAVLAYSVLSSISFKKRMVRREFLEQTQLDGEDVVIRESTRKQAVREFFDFREIQAISERYGKPITTIQMTTMFLIGTLIGIIIVFIYFHRLVFLYPFALMGGFIFIHIRLMKVKKDYISELDSKLAVYMNSVSIGATAFTNTKDLFGSVLPDIESPLKEDVQEAYLKLQDGLSVRKAFAKMNKKYNSSELNHFHDHLEVVIESGSHDTETLSDIAYKMRLKAKYRYKLKVAHKATLKSWLIFSSLSLTVPFTFIFVSFDNFLMILDSLLVSAAYAIFFAFMFFTYRKLESLELMDPLTGEPYAMLNKEDEV